MRIMLLTGAATASLMAAVVVSGVGASAQTAPEPTTSVTSSRSATGQPLISLTPEQQIVVRREVATPTMVPTEQQVEVGAIVPESVALEPVPQSVGRQIPVVSGYDFTLAPNKTVLVEPFTRRVVAIVSE